MKLHLKNYEINHVELKYLNTFPINMDIMSILKFPVKKKKHRNGNKIV